MSLWTSIWKVVKAVAKWLYKAGPVIYKWYKSWKKQREEAQKLEDKLRKGQPRINRALRPAKSDENLTLYGLQLKYELQQTAGEFVVLSNTVGRFIKNLELHSTNLKIHFESISNSVQMIKVILQHHRILENITENINKLNSLSGLPKLNSDLLDDSFLNNVNITKQYDAFTLSRSVLLSECEDFIKHLENKNIQAERFREISIELFGKSHPIISWINRDIIPQISRVISATEEIKEDLVQIPELDLDE